jgi:chromosome partitioning protein
MKKNITLVIANHKGGVGKTTTAVTLAAGLAALGYPALLVDCDPQGNVASFLGMDPGPGLYDLLISRMKPGELVRRGGAGGQAGGASASKLYVIPGDSSTVDVETLLRTSTNPRNNPRTVLKDALSPYVSNNGRPTVIILDTAPSLSSVQIAALSAADWLLIPASPEFASETGIGALAQAVTELQRDGCGVKLLGILPTLVDGRSKEHKRTIAELEVAFPGLVFPPIHRRIALAEAPREGRTIWEYNEAAAVDYAAALVEVRRRVGL